MKSLKGDARFHGVPLMPAEWLTPPQSRPDSVTGVHRCLNAR